MTDAVFLRWMVLLPLAGAVVNGVAGAAIQKAAGKRTVAAIACVPVGLSFLLAAWGLVRLAGLEVDERLLLDRLFTWIAVGGLKVDVAFQLDPLSVVMALVVTGVGGLIHVYSIAYMRADPGYWRYFALLNLFTFAMLVLVLADNLLLLFVGWEGVGLCSYALIGFWYAEDANAAAASKAFIVNRAGDFAFIAGMALLFWALSDIGRPSLAFRDIAAAAAGLSGRTALGMDAPTLVALLLFAGAAGKSAQIPLHVWLPDAMAGPTPVSALIHAATMVTAGVYLVARLNVLYTLAPGALAVVLGVGALTAFLAATVATAQNDLKRVLAYSTVSQLGVMFVAMGVGAYAAGVFHLVTHAFFKACLFLAAGSVIDAMHHEQDMRKMGGLARRVPVTYWTFLISAAALAGLPPLSGFISKDTIMWEEFADGYRLLWALSLCGVMLTSFYVARVLYLVFHGECRSGPSVVERASEAPRGMTVPLVILAVLVAIAGLLNWPLALSPLLPFVGVSAFEEWLRPVVGQDIAAVHGAVAGAAAHLDPIEYATMAISVASAAAGLLLGRAMYGTRRISADRIAALGGGALYRAVLNAYYVDALYRAVVVNGVLALGRAAAWVDRWVIDGVVDGLAAAARWVAWLEGWFDERVVDGAVGGVAWVSVQAGRRVQRLQTGSINGYLYVVAIAVAGVLVAHLWWGPVPG